MFHMSPCFFRTARCGQTAAFLLALLAGLIALSACGGEQSPPPTAIPGQERNTEAENPAPTVTSEASTVSGETTSSQTQTPIPSLPRGVTPVSALTPTPTLVSGPASTSEPTPTPTPTPTATETAGPIETPIPAVTPTSTITLTSTPEPTPTVTPTPTPTQQPTSTPVPTPTPHPDLNLRYHEEKRFVLELINEARADTGVPALELGNNISAQIHAENSLTGCYSSVWSEDGLKSDARYTLAGGQQFNNLSVIGKDYCAEWSDNETIAVGTIRSYVIDLFEDFGISRAMTDGNYGKASIGLAQDRQFIRLAILLERDFIGFEGLPALSEGVLTFSGKVKNGIDLDGGRGLSATVFYDPPPGNLTAGQIARVYSSDDGLRVAAIRRPASEGRRWSSHEYTRMYNPCPSPYDFPANSGAPQSPGESTEFYRAARESCLEIRGNEDAGEEITVQWITASEWEVQGDSFTVEADLSGIVGRHGRGLYKITIWGELNGEDIGISEFVIFHGIQRPTTYDVK